MYIKNIKLKNFRNYENLDLDLKDGINILYGDNAQGKTNILEALYISLTTKSHRTSNDKDIIKFENEEAHIKIILNKNEKDNIIDVHIKKDKNKGIALNKIKINKISEYFAISNIVLFSPEDLNIVKAGPLVRRKFIDFYICKIDKIYVNDLKNYNKILNQRNKLLKDIINDKSLINTLDIWDEELIKYAKNIIKKRKENIKILNEDIKKIYCDISDKKENIETVYEYDVDEENIYDEIKKSRENDLKYLNTQRGPHRDDIKFMTDNIDIRKFGSQGQKRTLILSLKLAELKHMKEIKKDNPILLLDDVFSELDLKRQRLITENIKDIQTVITCTGLPENILKMLNPKSIIYVKNGKCEIKK